MDGRAYGHGLEQDLEHLKDKDREESGDTVTPGTYRGTVRSRALSF